MGHETFTYDILGSMDSASDIVIAVAALTPLFNIETIEIGFDVDGYDVPSNSRISVTVTESIAIHAHFMTRALEIPNVSMILHD